jgi:hypothetical protein
VKGLVAGWISSFTPRPTTAAGPLIPCFSAPACQGKAAVSAVGRRARRHRVE